MEKFGYIYMTTNNINGMKYIGQHKSSVLDTNYKGSGDLLKPDLMEYKRQNFSVELLEWCESQEQLDEREKYWIGYYNATKSPNFYNIAPGGLNSFKGQKHTEAAKQLMSKHHKELVTPAFRNQMREIKLATNERKGKAFWVNNGIDEHLVTNEEYNNLLKEDNSYIIGRLPDIVYMNKDSKSIKIHSSEINDYIQQGFVPGKDDSICNNISKSRQHSAWFYDDIEFSTSGMLTEYLRKHGFPEITYSTVVNIANGKVVKKYSDLSNHLTRVYLD